MPRFCSILLGLLVVAFKVLWCGHSQGFQLSFVTWPNETQVVVNETVKFLWKYYVKGTDVDIKWGTAKYISTNVPSFAKIFFTAKNYEREKKVEPSKTIPDKYRDRVQIIGQASLQLVNVTLDDEGHYLCEIKDTNGWKILSRAAMLHVLIPPNIESHPSETILLKEEQQLRIGCKASGRPVPDVSWYKDKIELTQDAGSSEYVNEKVKRGDDGNYMCVAKNNASEVHYTVQVIVQYKPVGTKIKTDARSDTIRKGGDLKIVCEAESKPLPTYEFFHYSDDNLKRKIDDVQAANSGELYIRNVKASARGNYSCVPQNSVGSGLEAKVLVSVLYAPEIIKLSPSMNLTKKGVLKISCEAEGYPKPQIIWTKEADDATHLSTTKVYEKTVVDENDAGVYICTASNGNPPDAKKSLNVNVFYMPIIDEGASSTKIPSQIGSRVELKCIAKGNPTPSFEWKKDGHVRLGFKSSFVINSINRTHFGKYECEVSNTIGTTRHTVTVFEVEKPSVADVTVTHISGRSALITWKSVSFQNQFPIKYHVISVLENAKRIPELTIVPGEHRNSHNITNLRPYTSYHVQVVAWNDLIASDPAVVDFKTETAQHTPKLGEVKCIEKSSNVFILQWKRPVNMLGKTVKVLISLEWKIRHSGHYGKQDREIVVGKHLHSRRWNREISFDWKAEIKQLSQIRKLELKDLFPNTDYSVSLKERIRVESGILLWSSKTKSISIKTPGGVPSQPLGLTVNMQSDTTFSLTWKRPIYSGGKLKKYTIFYRTGAGDWMIKELKIDLHNETVVSIIDAETRNARYEVKVQASGHKPGLFSNTVQFTQESELLKVNIDSHSTNSFTVTWSKPSVKITKYTVFYRQKNGEWMSKDIVSGLSNDTLSVKVNGLTAGVLYEVKLQARSSRHVYLSAAHEVTSVTQQEQKGDETDYVPMFGGIIAGVLIFAFVIIVVAMLIRYNYRKRQRNQRRRATVDRPTPGVLITQDNGLAHMSSPSEHLSSDSPGSEKYLRTERKGNSVQVPLKLLGGGTKTIPVSNLLEYCKEHRKDANKGFSDEFKSIDSGAHYTYEECKKAENKSKNRYANIVTFDHTRVCLSNNGDVGSDYINANYIDGYNCPEKFIATQGPVAATFKDFWRMVWEQNCAAIVMVTNLMEKGKVKCQRYWPLVEAELFGSLTVNPIEEWELTDYTIRKFQLLQRNNPNIIRDVTQFHYTAWPDHGVPLHPTRLLAFVRRIQNYFHVCTGKIVVHCSAGVGRSGTFIALDALLEQIKTEGVVDVCGFVSRMRTQRSSMVQTEAQYSFIYEAILEASICGETEIALPDLTEKLELLEQVDSLDQKSLIVKEFENINILSVDEKETCVNALMPENDKKNRFSSMIPYDNNRVKLWPYPTEKGSDYINATFVDGFRNHEIFIASQAPLKESTEDFWRMIWEYECYVIIMLANLVEDMVQCAQYWPCHGEEYIVFGLLMIEVESEQELDSYTKRTLKCTNTKSAEVRRIYHIHYTAWLSHSVPDSSSSVLNCINDMLKLEQQTGNGLTVVQCSDGSGRSGTLIALYIALERLKLENITDVFSIVRNLRTQRVGMVENLEQYRFCYRALQEYTESCSRK